LRAAYVSTLAGGYPSASWRDGTGTNVYFNQPWAIGVTSLGTAYVLDSGSYIIRQINASGN
jgi:hypothetical protein